MGKQIETTETKPAQKLPAHLVAALKKYEQKKVAFGFTVTDVTPKGYGPTDSGAK